MVTGEPQPSQAIVRHGDIRWRPAFVSVPGKHLPCACFVRKKQSLLRPHGGLAFRSARHRQHGSCLGHQGAHRSRHGFFRRKQVCELTAVVPLAALEHHIALGCSRHNLPVLGQNHRPHIVARQPVGLSVKRPHLLRKHPHVNGNLRLLGRNEIDTKRRRDDGRSDDPPRLFHSQLF